MFDYVGELVVVVLFLVLLYFAWKSTEVRDTLSPFPGGPTRIPAAADSDVAIVPVRGTLLNRLVDQITTGSGGLRIRRRRPGFQTRLSNSVEQVEYNEGNILMTHVLSWANDSNDEGPEAIIRAMDSDLAETPTVSSTDSTPTTEQQPSMEADAGTAAEELQNCANENNENGSRQQVGGDSVDSAAAEASTEAGEVIPEGEEKWKIKIKYLNDEMKVVDAYPSQSLGLFKRQNFQQELAANKLVRLVFNGKVLQPDGSSLRSCALFENCVVHCLVHNMPPNAAGAAPPRTEQRPSTVDNSSRNVNSVGDGPPEYIHRQTMSVVEYRPPENGPQINGPGWTQGQDTGLYATFNLNRHRLEHWLLRQWNRLIGWRFSTEALLIIFTMITIYLRVRYADLFTATATIGLILVSVMVLGISVTLNIL